MKPKKKSLSDLGGIMYSTDPTFVIPSDHVDEDTTPISNNQRIYASCWIKKTGVEKQ